MKSDPQAAAFRRGVSLTGPDLHLLRAAVLDGDCAVANFRAWRDNLDWNAMSEVWQRILPLLTANLTRIGVSDPLLHRLRGLRRYFWAQNLRHVETAKRVFAAFTAAGIPAVGLKGIAIVAAGYADRSARPMDDIDILVRQEDLRAAVDLLETMGFSPAWVSRQRFFERIVPHSGLPGWSFRSVDRGEEVDLHWNSMRLDQRRHADDSAWDNARYVDFDEGTVRVFSPSDQLLRVLAHAALDGDTRGIRWITDALAIVRGGVDWSAFRGEALHHRISAVSARLLTTVESVASGTIAPAVVAQLSNDATIGERWEAHRFLSGQPSSPLQHHFKTAALLRRRRDDLFAKNIAAVALPYFRTTMGTRSIWHAGLRAGFLAIGRPPALRRVLASDRHLALPSSDLLPVWGAGFGIPDDTISEAAFVRGWSVEEEGGRWTDGPSATIAWTVSENRPEEIRLTGVPALHEAHPSITLSCFVDDVSVGTARFELGKPNEILVLQIPPDLPRGRIATLTLDIDRPFVPKEHQTSTDTRALGYLLQEVRFA